MFVRARSTGPNTLQEHSQHEIKCMENACKFSVSHSSRGHPKRHDEMYLNGLRLVHCVLKMNLQLSSSSLFTEQYLRHSVSRKTQRGGGQLDILTFAQDSWTKVSSPLAVLKRRRRRRSLGGLNQTMLFVVNGT